MKEQARLCVEYDKEPPARCYQVRASGRTVELRSEGLLPLQGTVRSPSADSRRSCTNQGAIDVSGRRMMEVATFDLPVFLVATFVVALVVGLAGFAFGIVAAAIWLHLLTPPQTASQILCQLCRPAHPTAPGVNHAVHGPHGQERARRAPCAEIARA